MLFEKGNRKQVYIKTFKHEDEIEVDLVKSYIFEAILVDEKGNKPPLFHYS